MWEPAGFGLTVKTTEFDAVVLVPLASVILVTVKTVLAEGLTFSTNGLVLMPV